MEEREHLNMTGSLAANFHEGSRSEYLAQYVFSSFGTAIPVPHQEDTGLETPFLCQIDRPAAKRRCPRRGVHQRYHSR
jgi:hypothetical protein